MSQPDQKIPTKADFLALDLLGAEFHHNHAVPKGFRDEPRTFDRECILIASEIFEAFEADRAGIGEEMSKNIPGFTNIEEEFADAIIRLLESSAARGIRVGNAVAAKHYFNKQRPHKHGKKF